MPGDPFEYETILRLTRELIEERLQPKEFRPGVDPIPYAGRVYEAAEVEAGVRSMLDFWLTLGKEGESLETELAKTIGVRRTLLVNSGSSANLVAISALTSPRLGERRILPGDEVITVAAGFPTTVSPIIQNGAVPVFLDNDPDTGNIRVEQLEDAYVRGKTKAVCMAHTLGNPFDLNAVVDFCRQHELWLIEDNCDALGSIYDGRLTGSFGDLSTQSFYPPHHITMGEGGAINITREARLKVLVESFRDWGRDCWCASGCDDTCGKRFGWQQGELPEGYDHKYIYSHLGYNLKPTDPQAAIGQVQLSRLDEFTRRRRANWEFLRASLAPLEDVLDFSLPTHATAWSQGEFSWVHGQPRTEPSWFGFMMLVKEDAPFTRAELARELDRLKIGNRMLFGGNLVRQPAFVSLRKMYERGETPGDSPPFRVASDLRGADRIMKQAIFIGVYPGLSPEQLAFMVESIHAFVRSTRMKASA